MSHFLANKKIIAVLVAASLLLPAAALAVALPTMPAGTAINLQAIIDNIFAIIWAVVASAVIIIFIVIGFLFLTAEGDPAKIATARRAVIWGTVGVVVILLSFSIIALVMKTFATGGGGSPSGGGGAAVSGACCVGGTTGCIDAGGSDSCAGYGGTYKGDGTSCSTAWICGF